MLGPNLSRLSNIPQGHYTKKSIMTASSKPSAMRLALTVRFDLEKDAFSTAIAALTGLMAFLNDHFPAAGHKKSNGCSMERGGDGRIGCASHKDRLKLIRRKSTSHRHCSGARAESTAMYV
jgi:hypothetical protein